MISCKEFKKGGEKGTLNANLVAESAAEADLRTYPPTPRTKILQRVRDDFHAVAKHAVQIELLVLVYHGRKEEDQAPAGIQEVPCKDNEVGRKGGELVRLGGR